MQTIKHTNGFRYTSPLFYEVDEMYSVLSDESTDSKVLFPRTFDSSFKNVYDTAYFCTGKKFEKIDFIKRRCDRINFEYDKKNIIVCYSGGKDSLVTIMHYKRLGYNVYAYHVKGLNRFYTDEWKIAERAAKEIGFELIFDEISYSGQHIWIEHPLKNMVMATMALNYGITHEITTKIAVGTFRIATLNDVSFEVCAGDCFDMWKMYENIIQRIIPGFKMYVPNANFHTAYHWLKKYPQYLPYTMSCLTPNRFRELFRNRTQQKYDIKLIENRCGCCWKCAVEYLIFADCKLFKLNKKYYVHCVEVLLHTLEQEAGYKFYSVQRIWETYMFYPISKSIMKKELENAIIRDGKIEITNEVT